MHRAMRGWRFEMRYLLLSKSGVLTTPPYHSEQRFFLSVKVERRMIDRIKVWANGGDGGKGCWCIRRSRKDWRGKPDEGKTYMVIFELYLLYQVKGGNGGRGGDVILECSPAVWDFSNLQHCLNAKRGGHGLTKKQIGTRGSDKVVQVPIGTVIHLISGEVIPLMEKVSSKSLQPWEIPENAEGEHSVAYEVSADSRERSDHSISRSGDYDAKSIKNDSPVCSSHMAICKGRFDNGLSSLERDTIQENDAEGAVNSPDLSDAVCPKEDVVQYAVAELTEPNQRVIIARGGAGGLGNAYFGKSSNPQNKAKHGQFTNKLQTMDDEFDDAQSSLTAGSPGVESLLILELKSIADVGLVGMPNAGKSTLLGAISRAKPAVGDYAFTTLRPNVGKLNYDDFFSVSVADIPGIIKGAHRNRGLGHAFLRHIERTKVLAYVVDLVAALDGRKGIPPWEQLRDLLLELEHHQKGLSNRPSLVVANKIDEDGAEDVLEELKRRVQGVPIFPVCAILEEGIPELKAGLRSVMDGREFPTLTLDNIAVDPPSVG